MKATLLVLKSFPRCYQCSDFSLAGQLSGLECGEFLLILALLWLQWTLSNAKETNPFKFHKADLARLPPSVLGRGPGVWGGVTLWASGRAWLASSDKTTTKHTLKKPTHLSSQQKFQNILPTGVQAHLYYHICHQSRKNRSNCMDIKNNFYPENLWWRVTTLQ